jgi:two-component system, NarL family, sensor kinase
VAERPELRLADLAEQPELYRILIEHAYRGFRIQVMLRAVLVTFVVLVVVFTPPVHDRGGCYAIAAVYAVSSAGVSWLVRRGGEQPLRLIWLALFVDLLALAALAIVASQSAKQSWTADVVVNGFFLIPVIAATQLRPWVCAAVAAPTVAVYLASSIASKQANTEPWGSILLRTAVLAGVAAGCVLLSRTQRSRVLTIGRLVSDRNELIGELVTIEGRERRELAESLHDGALQYVLAARQDLDDARHEGDAESFERLDHALRESSQLLRSTVTQLHPAVLEQAGLLPALRDLARTVASRGGFSVDIDADGWAEGLRTSVDGLLFATARELLTNVVKHAGATAVHIGLSRQDGRARLTVTDDGRGIGAGELERRLGEGHIGVASRRVRLEAAGGRLTLRAGQPTGTVAEVEVSASDLTDPA